MSPLRMIYLTLAVGGAVMPLYFTNIWFGEIGYDLSLLIAAWKANPATLGLYWNLIIASLALSIWVIAEVYVRKNWIALIAVPATFGIGLSGGLPLYLFLRTGPVR